MAMADDAENLIPFRADDGQPGRAREFRTKAGFLHGELNVLH